MSYDLNLSYYNDNPNVGNPKKMNVKNVLQQTGEYLAVLNVYM